MTDNAGILCGVRKLVVVDMGSCCTREDSKLLSAGGGGGIMARFSLRLECRESRDDVAEGYGQLSPTPK